MRASPQWSPRKFYAQSAVNAYRFEFYFDWGEAPAGQEWRVILNGTLFPQELLPKYQKQLDALNAEYRAKGLRV